MSVEPFELWFLNNFFNFLLIISRSYCPHAIHPFTDAATSLGHMGGLQPATRAHYPFALDVDYRSLCYLKKKTLLHWAWITCNGQLLLKKCESLCKKQNHGCCYKNVVFSLWRNAASWVICSWNIAPWTLWMSLFILLLSMLPFLQNTPPFSKMWSYALPANAPYCCRCLLL